jgi:putative Holliday junction resolvase
LLNKRYLGVDLGTKRIGLAVTDPFNNMAQPYQTILFDGKNKLVKDLELVIREKNIGTIIFGLPLTLSETESIRTKETRVLVNFLRTKIDSEIEFAYQDESLSTKEAHVLLREMGKKPSKNRDLVDQLAAYQILKAYLKF